MSGVLRIQLLPEILTFSCAATSSARGWSDVPVNEDLTSGPNDRTKSSRSSP